MFVSATLTQSYRSRGQDRVDVILHPQGLVAVVADGAGGTSGGAEAADTMIMWARAHSTQTKDLRSTAQWGALLEKVDRQINFDNGQTTGVVVALVENGLVGASVGDSSAWLIGESGFDDLTADQVRKPLLGTGAARPVVFERNAFGGTLLLGSDGLIKYVPPARICEIARLPDLQEAVKSLVNLVRLKSGALQDDVAVVLCRRSHGPNPASAGSGRRRYRLTDDGNMIEDVPHPDEDVT